MIRLLNKMDKPLLLLTIIMFLFGLFMILDASSMKSFIVYGVSTRYFTKQLAILIISFIAGLVIILIPPKKFNKYVYLASYLISFGIIFLLMSLIVSGTATNNSKSWFYVGPVAVQPSEIAKVAIILHMACYYKYNIRNLDELKSIFPVNALIPVIIGGFMTLLTLLQPDGGTGLIIFSIVVFLFYISPVATFIKARLTGFGFVLLLLLITVLSISGKSIFTGMQKDRFNFSKPCTRYQESTGYQVCNGYIAINNGKIFSIDPGNSKQKYLYLPEAYTDFIFPIIVEEMGLVTGIFIILLYFIIILRIIIIGRKSPDIQNQMVCYGVAFYIFMHVFVNLVGVLGLLPLTGVPLPFLSYGGSFALSLSMALALIQRISIDNYNSQKRRVLY